MAHTSKTTAQSLLINETADKNIYIITNEMKNIEQPFHNLKRQENITSIFHKSSKQVDYKSKVLRELKFSNRSALPTNTLDNIDNVLEKTSRFLNHEAWRVTNARIQRYKREGIINA